MKRTATGISRTSSDVQRDVALNTQTDRQTAAASTVKDTARIRIVAGTETEQSSDEEVTTTIREYDTNRPVDPATGTPPLKRETVQRRQRAETGRQRQKTETAAEAGRQTAAQINDRQTANSALSGREAETADGETQTAVTEKRGLNPLQKVLCTLGTAALIAGAVIGLNKYFRLYR